jgi:hypothetical protein
MKSDPRSAWFPWILLCFGVGLLLGCKTTAPAPDAPPAVSPGMGDSLAAGVEGFVRQTHVHGVPYEAAREWGLEAVPILESMLADAAAASTWPNVVVTLAMVGDAPTGHRLIEFIQQDPGRPLSASHCMAKYSALMALGYLVNHTSDPDCLDFLVRAARPAYWETLAPQWSSPFESTSIARNLQLANMAMLGLALSGHPDAIVALESMKEPEMEPARRRLQATRSGLLDEALEASRAIARDGLAEYYRRARNERHSAPGRPAQ